MPNEELTERVLRLLEQARYVSLATTSPQGSPWVSVLEYAWFARPLRLVFGSPAQSLHSRHIAERLRVAGALFTAGGGPELDVDAIDGAQFSGRCRELSGEDLLAYHRPYYEKLFSEEEERARWMLPSASLRHPAAHRLYLIEVDRLWLVDTRTWEEDRVERRVEVPLTGL
ncbi:pyridoxamine 5'-phosphate oxidase family protein [Streptomyces sp. NPDC056528]|uniref:pyridoxamine 5'-phosphate oxidase family protein n=1 Tax=Streptomyces sp. NPDC056528 TaxID=3345854 RepID=UPI0036B3C1C7